MLVIGKQRMKLEVLGMENAGISFYGKVAYHHSCHLLRELGVGEQPLKLLKSTRGLEYVEMENADQCCGFGGSFSVRYPEISRTLVDDKIDNIKKAGADSVVVNDTGCIMNISGRLGRRGEKIKVLHLAELLAASK